MRTTEQDEKRPIPQSSTQQRSVGNSVEEPTFSYWMDIIEHTCDSTDPIGSCLSCDLQQMQEELLEQSRLLGMSGEREIDLRSRIRSLEDQLDCAMWCLERADKRAADWQDCARRLVENGMPNSWKSRVEWYKAKSYHKHMSKVEPHNL